MTLEGLSFVGAGRGAPGGRVFTALDAATGEALPGEFWCASAAEVDAAARAAAEAFGEYARWPGARRAALLRSIAGALEADAARIVERAGRETALPAARLEGELARTCFQLRLYGAAAERGLLAGARIDHADTERKPLPKPDLRAMARPLGPVAVFGASNFPLAFSVAGGDTASALAAGCPVVVKAHPAHPGTSEMVGALVRGAIKEAGAPAGVFSLLFDSGHEVGAALVEHPEIKAVGFTGSRAGGRALMDLAAARPEPIPVFAEMSSVNPVFVLAGALADQAEAIATGLHASVTLGVGQFCTNPGLVFVEDGAETPRFMGKLASLFSAAPVGTMLTADILGRYEEGVGAWDRLPGVGRLAVSAAPADGARARPAVFVTDLTTFLATPVLAREVFGPCTLIVLCPSAAAMSLAAAALEGQLTATIHARPEELVERGELVERLAGKAGRLLHGGFPTGVDVCHAMVHGGPYPATSDGASSSVGTLAPGRFLRPVAYQNFPDAALPPELQEANPLGIWRLVDGEWRSA